MKSSEKIALALDIIPYLSQHNGITPREAAAHFGITPRELTSILNVAVLCGVPGYFGGDLIDIDVWGDNICVITAQGLDKPLRFSPAERAALTLALQQLEKVPGLVNSAAVKSVLAKLQQPQQPRRASVSRATRTARMTGTGTAAAGAATTATTAANGAEEETGLAERLTDAIAKRHTLTIDYLNGAGELTTDRHIMPYRLIVQEDCAYLIACAIATGELRQFRLDRIMNPREGDCWEGGEAISAADIDRFIEGAESIPKKARIAVRSDAAWLVDVLGITITDRGPATLHGTLLYFTEAWLLRVAQRYAAYMVVQEPEHIEKIVVNRARQALAR